jgi:hypothetical protein
MNVQYARLVVNEMLVEARDVFGVCHAQPIALATLLTAGAQVAAATRPHDAANAGRRRLRAQLSG